jgi:hypothetical protein
MLTCSGCRVARFCRADHQRMASKSVASGGNLLTGRHKDICGLLGEQQKLTYATHAWAVKDAKRQTSYKVKRVYQ